MSLTIIHEVSMGQPGQDFYKNTSIKKIKDRNLVNYQPKNKLAYSIVRMTENRGVLLSQDILIKITLLPNLNTVSILSWIS